MAFESIQLIAEDQEVLNDIELSMRKDPNEPISRHIGEALHAAFKHFALASRGGTNDKPMILKETKMALRELNEGIGEFFHSGGGGNKSEEHWLFDDVFKGLLNAGKMYGRGLKNEDMEKVLKRNIEYNGNTTNLGEVLKNINWSQEQLNIVRSSRGLRPIEITDFSGMDLDTLVIKLQDIWEDSLPSQLQVKKMQNVRRHLADKMADGARFAGCLELILEDNNRPKIANERGSVYGLHRNS